MELSGKTVLVTGGSQGLGEQLCRELAAVGMHVIVNCARSAARAEMIAKETGGRALVFDIADSRAVWSAFEQIETLDVLINNARVDPYKRPAEMEDAVWFDRVFGVNLKGPYLCSFAAAEKMKEHGGKIVNISSVWAYRAANRRMLEYAMSKAALHTLTRSLAKQLAPGITVNAVAPGMIESKEIQERLTPQEQEALRKSIPLARAGTAREISNAVRFLLENDYVTGEILNINGGTQFV